MYCSKCGNQLSEEVAYCPNCGNSLSNTNVKENVSENSKKVYHDIPKCSCCGNIAPWKKGPIIRKVDIFIGIALLLFGFFPGAIYFGVVALIRSNKNNREKICSKCGAQNLFTFEY